MPPARRRGARSTTVRTRSRGHLSVAAPRRERPQITIKPESLADFNESINILLYGNSGVGKTVLAGGAPNAYFLSTEKGVVSAKRTGSSAQLIRAPDWDHVEAGLDWADANLGPEDWMLVDSGTKMQILLLRWWLGGLNAENEARDIDIPQIQDHQKWQNMYIRFWDRMMDAQYNTIITATTMLKEDPDGESLVMPAITGKDYTISGYCCAQADMVLYYGVAPRKNMREPTIRRLLSETYPPYFAKDRFNVLPRWTDIDEGDYRVMSDIISEIMATDPESRKAAKAADQEEE